MSSLFTAQELERVIAALPHPSTVKADHYRTIVLDPVSLSPQIKDMDRMAEHRVLTFCKVRHPHNGDVFWAVAI